MEKMLERAKEELDMLEALHPDRFDYLKLELESFMSLLRSQQLVIDHLPTTSCATTQASTSMKRKREYMKKGRNMGEDKESRSYNKVRRRRKDGVDVALEKAQACLRKIQNFKFSLSC